MLTLGDTDAARPQLVKEREVRYARLQPEVLMRFLLLLLLFPLAGCVGSSTPHLPGCARPSPLDLDVGLAHYPDRAESVEPLNRSRNRDEFHSAWAEPQRASSETARLEYLGQAVIFVPREGWRSQTGSGSSRSRGERGGWSSQGGRSGGGWGVVRRESLGPLVAGNGDVRGADNDGDGRRETVFKKGYTRKDGTRVRSHYSAPPKRGKSRGR